MISINEKLAYLEQTKSEIASAIKAKGVSISSSDTFRSYANKIRSISGSAGVSTILEELLVNENGIYISENGKAYNVVNVDVSLPIMDTLTVHNNGTYTPNNGKVYNSVVVDVNSFEYYLIRYDANGGTGAPVDTYAHEWGSLSDISSSEPERINYHFIGWALSSSAVTGAYSYNGRINGTNSSISNLSSGVSISKGETITLYAVWEEVGFFRISYNANGGSGAPGNSDKFPPGTRIDISSTIPTRSGYEFKGWALSSSATIGEYSYNGSILGTSESISDTDTGVSIVGGTITLYAVWEAYAYKVSYNANGGTGAPSDTDFYNFGTPVSISSTIPTRSNYEFKGWTLSSTATTGAYSYNGNISNTSGTISNASSGVSVVNGGTITLYAVWEAYTYKVSYNANGGTGAPSDTDFYNFGTPVSISSTIPTRSNYEFKGWALSSTATAGDYSYNGNISGTIDAISNASSGVSVVNGGTITLYAVWKIFTYMISYDVNGGSGVPEDNNQYPFGTIARISSTIPTRSGYEFKGWALSSTATTGAYSYNGNISNTSGTISNASSGVSVVNGGSITLYAVWAQYFTISYNANGGSGAPVDNNQYLSGTSVSISSTIPTRSDNDHLYEFEGWSLSSSATTGDYSYNGTISGTSGTITSNGGIVKLYAVWKEVQFFTISYIADGASGVPVDNNKYPVGTYAPIAEGIPTKDYHDFYYWYTNSEYTGSVYCHEAGMPWENDKITSNTSGVITLYARMNPYCDFEFYKNETLIYSQTQVYYTTGYHFESNAVQDLSTNTSESSYGGNFKGWALSRNATTSVLDDYRGRRPGGWYLNPNSTFANTIIPGSTVRLYAIWSS